MNYLISSTLNTRVAMSILLASAVLLFALSPSNAETLSDAPSNAPSNSEQTDTERAAAMVRQLGDRKFAVRERAMHDLFALGLPAVHELHKVLDHRDREVRRRSARALAEIARRDRPRRLAMLTSGAELTEFEIRHALFGIPGLDKLVKIAGDSSETRRMLATALRADWELIENSSRRDMDTLELIEKSCSNTRTGEAWKNGGVRPETIVAIVTASILREQALPDRTAIQVYSLMSQMDKESPSLSKDGTAPWELEPFRRLIGAFVLGADGPTAVYQGLKVSMEHNLSEGLASAERIVRGGYTLPHIRQFAILTIARFGSESHIADLQNLLEDEDVCFTRRQSGTRSNFECQVRDLAMAATLHIVGKDPREFGFRKIETSEHYVYQPHTVGFESVADREAALAKFRVLLASNIRP